MIPTVSFMDKNLQKPLEFVAVFLGIFFLAALLLSIVDFVPDAPSQSADTSVSDTQTALATSTVSNGAVYPIEEPTRIKIPAVGIDTAVINPSSTNTDTLDNALLSGAVHYPGSGLLGENAR